MAKKKAAPKFPKVLYGIIESDGGYVLTSDALEGIDGEDGDYVGVYELKAVKRLRLNAPDLE